MFRLACVPRIISRDTEVYASNRHDICGIWTSNL